MVSLKRSNSCVVMGSRSSLELLNDQGWVKTLRGLKHWTSIYEN